MTTLTITRGRKCGVQGCDHVYLARSMCRKHYSRWRGGKSITPGTPHMLDGTAQSVFDSCTVLECERLMDGNSIYCNAHTQRIRLHGSLQEERPIIIKGNGRYVDSDGYIVLTADDHPNASRGSIFEHVKVMSASVGRALHKEETVHHRNGIRADNRIENLELWSGSHPRGSRVSDQIIWALEILSLYGKDAALWVA